MEALGLVCPISTDPGGNWYSNDPRRGKRQLTRQKTRSPTNHSKNLIELKDFVPPNWANHSVDILQEAHLCLRILEPFHSGR